MIIKKKKKSLRPVYKSKLIWYNDNVNQITGRQKIKYLIKEGGIRYED